MQAAVLISLYHHEEPILGHAFRLLQAILDVDELMTQWRTRHSLMVHRSEWGGLPSHCLAG